MTFLSKNRNIISRIYVLALIYSWTMLMACTQEDTLMKQQSPHFHLSLQKKTKFSEKHYRIYDSSGKPSTLESIIYQFGLVDVAFLGEMHDDPVAHYIQELILRETTDRYWRNAYSSKRRQIVLSMEMFERDIQMILDEYLFKIIDDHHFLSCVRPWRNYIQDYHPMVKFAQKNNLKVLAANAPRRYVHRVAQKGPQALDDLSTFAKTCIAPLPIKPPSEKMKKKFDDLQQKESMRIAHEEISSTSHFVDAQNLWDATMAYSIHEELSNTPRVLILHLNGFFHSQSGIGIPEHLTHYRPDVKMMLINIVRNESFPKFHPSLKNTGDFVIITEPNIWR